MPMPAAAVSRVSVSMMDFLRSGTFGPLRLGASRDFVSRILGEPDEIPGPVRRQLPAPIWKYGVFEFRFATRTDTLDRIRVERCERLDGGSRIQFDPWYLGMNAKLEDVQREFGNFGIPMETMLWPYSDNTQRFRAGAGITLIFQQQAPQKFLGFIYTI